MQDIAQKPPKDIPADLEPIPMDGPVYFDQKATSAPPPAQEPTQAPPPTPAPPQAPAPTAQPPTASQTAAQEPIHLPRFRVIEPGSPEMRSYIARSAANRTETENYFCGVRGLTAETVAKFQLGFDAVDRAAVIPYPGETYCIRRFTAIDTDAKGERKYDNPGGDKPVFNAPALKQDRCPVFVLEGQIDALSIIDAGGQACTGQNEQSAFVELAEKSPAPGFIIVSDQDKHGATVTESLKAALQRKGLTVETAVMPPGIHDVNEFLRKQGREALAHWIHQRELTITPEIITIRELQEKIEAEGEADPNELIKRRFICKGAAGILAAETGCGKSSFIMQIALHWGAGLPCFGLEPIRPLKILLIQAENDNRDLMEEISGVCRGASNVELLSAPQIAAAKEAVRIISDSTHSGDGFITMLDRSLKRAQGTDIVIIDPLFAFAGCDLSDQERVSRFLRNQINPILQEHNVAAIFVHHMAKPSRNATPDANFNTAYSYHGSGEIINWARYSIILERFTDKDGEQFYKLTAPKRGLGGRLDWETKYLRWSKKYIYWEELQNAPEMEHTVAKEDRAKQREEEKQRRLIEGAQRVAEILQPGESMTATELRRAIAGRLLITSKDRIEAVLSVCADRGFLVKRAPTEEEKTKPGIRAIYERPAEPPTQPEIF